MAKRKRKMVRRQRDVRWDLDGLSLKDVATRVQEWIAQYGEDARIDIDSWTNAPVEVNVVYYTPETDEERAARVERERASKEAEQERRRRLYEDLKKEFEE